MAWSNWLRGVRAGVLSVHPRRAVRRRRVPAATSIAALEDRRLLTATSNLLGPLVWQAPPDATEPGTLIGTVNAGASDEITFRWDLNGDGNAEGSQIV
jgi:hypothetical protein